MKKFKRNPQTGILEVCENGKKVGEIITMGDILMSDEKKEKTVEIKKGRPKSNHPDSNHR